MMHDNPLDVSRAPWPELTNPLVDVDIFLAKLPGMLPEWAMELFGGEDGVKEMVMYVHNSSQKIEERKRLLKEELNAAAMIVSPTVDPEAILQASPLQMLSTPLGYIQELNMVGYNDVSSFMEKNADAFRQVIRQKKLENKVARMFMRKIQSALDQNRRPVSALSTLTHVYTPPPAVSDLLESLTLDPVRLPAVTDS